MNACEQRQMLTVVDLWVVNFPPVPVQSEILAKFPNLETKSAADRSYQLTRCTTQRRDHICHHNTQKSPSELNNVAGLPASTLTQPEVRNMRLDHLAKIDQG